MLDKFNTPALLACILTTMVLLANVRMYGLTATEYRLPSLGPDVLKQLHFIKHSLHDGSAENMQAIFPEGYFFSHVLYALSWVEVARRENVDSPLWKEAIAEAESSKDALKSAKGKAVFEESLSPPYGIFYCGWLTWLEGGLLMVTPPDRWSPSAVQSFNEHCEQIASAFENPQSPFLQSYRNNSWPTDSTEAIAALKLHDKLFSPKYVGAVSSWVARAKAHVDPETGLLPHQVDPNTGNAIQSVRGTSSCMSSRFIKEIDPEWGDDQYKRFRRYFVASMAGLPGTLEYKRGTIGIGDVDSGPLVFGFSPSASVVAIAAAQANGDIELANEMIPAAEASGIPFEWGQTKAYGFALLPIGDEFVVWSKSTSSWTNESVVSVPHKSSPFWRLPFHLWSFLSLVAIWTSAIFMRDRQLKRNN